MRVGLSLNEPDAGLQAVAAEEYGLFGVLVQSAKPGAEMVIAGEVSSLTSIVRVIVRIPLGHEHPVTMAEEIAVLDNLAEGRIVALLDTGGLSVQEAAEDVQLMRHCWASRPVRHRGERWRVPAEIEGHNAPDRVMVTPKPAQLDVPVWLTGDAASQIAEEAGLPAMAQRPEDASADTLVQPGLASMKGDMEADRELVTRWAEAGTTHLILTPPDGADVREELGTIARYLAPEVAMPEYPRVISETMSPAAWSGPLDG